MLPMRARYFALPLLFAAACMPKGGGEADAIKKPFEDTFDRAELGERYKKSGESTWTIKDGALHSTGDHNVPLWLDVPLPRNVKVEFTAWSLSPQVDEIEIFGDGKNHESGYIVILGGWNNRITTIARLDEHEKKRPELRKRWEQGRKYRWTVQRTDGKTLELLIDGELVLKYEDDAPLFGPKHNKLGFSNWESDVYYDDLVITPLP